MFTTGLLLEVSKTPTRRQLLANQVRATPNDVLEWRDEALLLNLGGFGPAEHRLICLAGLEGLAAALAVEPAPFPAGITRGGQRLRQQPPADLQVETWWQRARTLAEE